VELLRLRRNTAIFFPRVFPLRKKEAAKEKTKPVLKFPHYAECECSFEGAQAIILERN